MSKPRFASAGPHGIAQSDDFGADGAGICYAEFQMLAPISERVCRENNSLIVRAQGAGVADSSPLVWNVGDHRYEMTVEVAPGRGARGGLLLYNSKLLCGLGVDQRQVRIHQNGADLFLLSDLRPEGERLWLKIVNDNDALSMAYSTDNRTWKPA